MDQKGMSWVNNMYQKLESLCVEVEENIYEDTVKYVEGQVKTVGACVKKFYSDVVEDLLPPVSQDPASREYEKPEVKKDSIDVDLKRASKEPLVDAPVKKHIDNGSPGKLQRKRSDFFKEYLDSLESIQDKHLFSKTMWSKTSDFKDLSECGVQHDDNSDVVCGHANEGALLAAAITGRNCEEAKERDISNITVKKHVDNRPIVKKDTIKLERKQASTGSLVDAPVKEHLDSGSFVKKDTIKVKHKVGASKSVVDASVKKHLDDGSSHISPSKLQREWADYLEINLSQDKYCPSTSMPKTSDSKDLSESHSDQHDENSEVICDLTNGGSLLAAATTGSNSKEAKESETCEKFSNFSVWPTTYIAGPRLSHELNAVVEAGENCSQRLRMPSSKALSVELDAAVDIESPKSKNAETIKTANEEISHTVKSDKLFGEDTGFDDSDDVGVDKQGDDLKLVESCVMVNKNDCFILNNQGKQRSYKKKIRDVFSLRKRSKDKVEHEQLAVWYDEENGKELVSTSTAVSHSVTSDSVEAEWELV